MRKVRRGRKSCLSPTKIFSHPRQKCSALPAKICNRQTTQGGTNLSNRKFYNTRCLFFGIDIFWHGNCLLTSHKSKLSILDVYCLKQLLSGFIKFLFMSVCLYIYCHLTYILTISWKYTFYIEKQL